MAKSRGRPLVAGVKFESGFKLKFRELFVSRKETVLCDLVSSSGRSRSIELVPLIDPWLWLKLDSLSSAMISSLTLLVLYPFHPDPPRPLVAPEMAELEDV